MTENCGSSGKRLIKKEAEPFGPTSLKGFPKVSLSDPLRRDLIRSGRSLVFQRGAGFFDQTVESDFVPDREICEDLSVKGDVRSGQALDKSTVADAIQAAGGIDPHDP